MINTGNVLTDDVSMWVWQEQDQHEDDSCAEAAHVCTALRLSEYC